MSTVCRKRVYLSGPMTGLPDYNRAAFARARVALKRAGASYVFDPSTRWVDGKDRAWYMRHDIAELARTDTSGRPWYQILVSLPGWQMSDGAWCEALMAEEFGIEVAELAEVTQDARE